MTKMIMPAVSLAALACAAPRAVTGAPRMEIDAGKLEKLLHDVKASVSELDGRVKQTAEDALKQARDAGQVSAETKRTADELLFKQKSLTDAQASLEKKFEALETKNQDLEQHVSQRRSGGEEVASFGARIAKCEQMRAFASGGSRGNVRVQMPVKQAITSIKPGGGGLIWSDREAEIVGMPQRTMTIRSLLMQGRTNSPLIEFARQVVRTNAAAIVPETMLKPESTYSWEQASAKVVTIAHFIHVARQTLEDADQLETEIDGELRYGLAYAEEMALLTGDGVGPNPLGLIPAASAYVAPLVLPGATIVDTLRLAILQASLAEYPADGIVLSRQDWARIELTKDTAGWYVVGNPLQRLTPSLWGRPVVDTPAMQIDKFLVGAFKMAATIYDRMDPEVVASSEDRDNFIKNMITIRAEERLALAIKRPGALIYGDFGLVP